MEKPGDFRRRTVAGRPLFWVRGSDGEVRVFHNTCTHWGANVCRVEQCNAGTFRCFYHAWTFDNKGKLISVPDEPGYSAAFDKSELSLVSPPRLEQYRSLYFISFDPHVIDLVSYLGEARKYLDYILDQSGPDFIVRRREAEDWTVERDCVNDCHQCARALATFALRSW